ncbi:MAG: 23S rRNA (adenine(2503)-C(2))-methyltransferase RlmN [Oscillospiraceae bacterium]|jgi:23S rRNA (adenine2503-C2)-methyltransferase|nr:23S rRNA (adenine(2503)-C(2))-methyltransferase RlmN [Oscillospiraceae bacterium]
MKTDIKSFLPEELEREITAAGQPKYRAKQVFNWLHVKNAGDFSQMTNLPGDLIRVLDKNFYILPIKIKKKLVSSIDNTVKFLCEYDDGQTSEAVFMQYHYGNSLCISSQIGCKMGCAFCASTLAGFARNLRASEMLAQISVIEAAANSKISRVVLMGIGEPLDNFENVLRFLRLVSCPEGRNLSGRNITLSTCGIADKIYELAEYRLGITLAVSLHAPDNALRSRIMPVNRRWPLEEVIKAAKYYANKTGRRATYEYALIRGENDGADQARRLAGLLRGSLCHVNLIPVNEVKERGFKSAARQGVLAFAAELEKNGIAVTIRRSLGQDINAACGQLRREELQLADRCSPAHTRDGRSAQNL